MESPKVDVVRGSAKLIVTKRSLQIIRGYGSYTSDCEVYPLTHVVGFRCGPSRGPEVAASNGSAITWFLCLGALAAATYGLLNRGLFTGSFLLPALTALFLFILAAELQSQPSLRPTMQYGLLITFHSGEDKLIPGQNRFEVENAVSQFSTFMDRGAYLSHLVVENDSRGMRVTLERHCPC